MGIFNFRKKKDSGTLMWTLNPAGTWVYPSSKNDTYIDGAYKSMPNVYGIITAILEKSTIVPFEIFRVKNGRKYNKYKGMMKNATSTSDVARTIKYKNDSLEKVEGSDVEKLLMHPNSYQSIEKLWWEIDGYKLLTGNSTVYMLSLSENRPPMELHSIPSTCVDLKVKGSPFEPEFKYKVNYLQDPLPGEEVLHFKTWNPIVSIKDPSQAFWGVSPLMSCRKLLGRYADADVAMGSMFQNQGPAGVLYADSDKQLTEEQARALQDKYEQQYGKGSGKKGSVVIAGGKVGWISTGLSPVDLNILDSKSEILGELCNVYHVPVGMFSDRNSTENNMIEGRKQMITDAVIPLVESRKNVLQNQLLTKYSDDLVIEFDYTVFHELQEDLNKLAETYAKMDWVTDNERRAATGFDRYEDPAADVIYKASGLVPISDLNGRVDDIDETQLQGYAETDQ